MSTLKRMKRKWDKMQLVLKEIVKNRLGYSHKVCERCGNNKNSEFT